MPRRFVDVFGDGNRPRRNAGPARRAARPAAPGAQVTSAETDTESGTDGTGGQAQALQALQAMYDRGLIPEADYRARKAEIEAGKVNPEDNDA
jgi:hypothetical protein